MNSASPAPRLYWLSYPIWIALCALLFAALAHAPDPARRGDRIDDDRATVIALRYLRTLDASRYADYDVVHVTFARRGEAASDPRWLILCDRHDRTALRAAVVVELRARDGAVIDVRAISPSDAAIGDALPTRRAQ